MIKLSIKLCFSILIILSPLSQAAIPAGNGLYPSLAPMLKTVNPAVVNIATYSTQKNNNTPLQQDPFFKNFLNTPDQQEQKHQQSAGSGVIVNAKKGIIVTNNHVIDNADEIQVSLIDGRSFKATLLGQDPDLDIAILQIKATNLTAVKIADSSKLEVGDFVVAIGNPFGLGQTVTTGIVSALGRSGLGIEGYENFIQTDASINPGNSGGALVNLGGELIGINTAIIAPSGGNVGIGFAIPINMVKASLAQITEYGKVRRGKIGIGIQDITPALRDMFELKNGQMGVLVTSVVANSPAEQAGVKPGDVILQVNEQATKSTGQLRSAIGIKKIGERVKLTLLRNGKSQLVTMKIGAPQRVQQNVNQLHPLLAGAEFENTPNGVMVKSLTPNSIPIYSGLRAGDIIVAANKYPIDTIKTLRMVLKQNPTAILLQLNRNGGSLFIVIR